MKTDHFIHNTPPPRWHGVLFILFLGLAAGCSGEPDSGQAGSSKDFIVTVNGQRVPVAEFNQELKAVKGRFRVADNTEIKPEELLWLKSKALNEVIRINLLKQEAVKNRIQVTQAEFEEAMEKVKSGYQEDGFQRYLEIQKISLPEWESKLKNNILIKKLIERTVNSKVSVGDEELLEYFNNHEEEFHKGKQVRAQHIMVETEELARTIKKLLNRKRKKFSDLAREYSMGPEGPNGGELGYLEAGQMPPEFDEIFKLSPSEVSDVIQTPYGFHIFKVTEIKQDQKMSFQESRKTIQERLLAERRDKAFQDWLARLKARSTMEINNEVFEQIN